MNKTIYGIRSVALNLGVSVERIRRLIILKIIRPKRDGMTHNAPYKFDAHDQEIIRQHTSMRD